MKKWLIPACIVGVLLMGSVVALTKETNKKYVISNAGGAFDYVWQKNGGIQPSGKIVTIAFDHNLSRLDNQISINVRQYCGAMGPRIEIDAALLAELDQDQLKQGIISSKRDIAISQKMPPISFHSGDQVKEVNNSGTGNMAIHCPDRSQFTLRNFGTGNVTIDDIYMKNAEIQNRGTGNILFDNVEKVNVDTRGTGSVSFNKVDIATVNLYGVGNVNFANTPKITSTVKGLGSIKTNVTPSAESSH